MKKIQQKYHEIWNNALFNDEKKISTHGNKLRTYRQFKSYFQFEPYLSLLPYGQRYILTRFRIGAHKLEIEKGRHYNIDVEKRICKLCNDGVEDETHFLLTCKSLSNIRDPFLNNIKEKYKNIELLDNNPMFIWLLSNEEKYVLCQVCALLKELNEHRDLLLATQN